MRNESWPFRRSDALFVVAVVLFSLPDPANEYTLGISSTALKLGLVGGAVATWIRFRVFGDRGTR